MAWVRIYGGDFLDIRSVTWTVEILRDITDGSAVPDDSSLTFPADSPLVIEWPSQGFEDVMWGSTATLRLVSDSDRRFIDLYTIEPGTIRLDIYRAGSLYWSGMLDPEFYEEPYESLSGYEVELTFSDFGILKRLKYDLTEFQTAGDIISRAVEMAGINTSGSIRRELGLNFVNFRVNSENFTDEEGETMSMYDAVEGILKPLGVRMAQRNGRVWLYDLDGIECAYDYGETAGAVVWTGDSQTLGVDKVYNSVTVTFSPYARSTLLEDCIVYESEYRVTWYDLTNDNTGKNNGGATCFTYHPDYSKYGTGENDYSDLDFTIFLGEAEGASVLKTTGDASTIGFFHMLPVYGSAEECSGVYWTFCTGGHSSLKDGYPHRIGEQYPKSAAYTTAFVTWPRVFIPGIADDDTRKQYLIRLVQEMMLDCRYNPFNDASDDNEKSNQSTLEDNSAFVFIRAFVRLYDSETGGTCLYHYDNSNIAQGQGCATIGFGAWSSGAGSSATAWLEWYNPDNLKDNSGGAGGWKANRHCIGRPDGKGGRNSYTETNSLLRHADDGEYIPYPPEGGWLEVSLLPHVYAYQWGNSAATGETDRWTDKGVYDILRWWLYKAPLIAVVNNSLVFDDADFDDVEYKGTLNAAAENDLSIDTICGTAEDAPPTARGVFLTSSGEQLGEVSRDWAYDRPERLLINQLYRQYADRRTVITGEAEIPPGLVMTEPNQGDKLFVLMADSQDIRSATSDIEIREIGQDRYTPEK